MQRNRRECPAGAAGRCEACSRRSPRGIDRRIALRLISSAVAAPALAGCDLFEQLPVQFVSEETVRRLSLESWQRIRQRTPLSSNAGYQQLLQDTGSRLLAAAGGNAAHWEMRVFAGQDANAFALPGGKIGVFEGMFRVAAGADQLSAVVGHEIGHILAEHSRERLSAMAARDLGIRLVRTALEIGDVEYANEIAALLGVGAEFGLILPYSRRQEIEADRLGLLMMADAGFNPAEAVELWRRMDRMAGPRPPAFLSTHPAPRSRIEAIEELVAETASRER